MKPIDEILKNKKIWGSKVIFLFHSAFIKLPDCGTCIVIWSDCENGYEHVSVSPKKKFNIPTWNDMCVLKDVFFYEEEEAYQIHPKKSQYINAVSNCLHLWKPAGHELDELTEKQHTAFDVDEVAKELEDTKDTYTKLAISVNDDAEKMKYIAKEQAMLVAIGIVKGQWNSRAVVIDNIFDNPELLQEAPE